MSARQKVMTGQKKGTSRKQKRKEERKNKKHKKMLYFSKKFGHTQEAENPSLPSVKGNKPKPKKEKQKKHKNKELSYTDIRKIQLKEANEEEDRSIRRLEKMLKLKKRKSKNIPKSFCADGLDYILELTEHSEDSHLKEFEMNAADTEINDDLSRAVGRQKSLEENEKYNSDEEQSDFDSDGGDGEGFFVDEKTARIEKSETFKSKSGNIRNEMSGNLEEQNVGFTKSNLKRRLENEDSTSKRSKIHKEDVLPEDTSSEPLKSSLKLKSQKNIDEDSFKEVKRERLKVVQFAQGDTSTDDDEIATDISDNEGSEEDTSPEANPRKVFREDIYGRLRDEDGNVVKINTCSSDIKYVPPAKRNVPHSIDAKKQETQMRIHRQMRGLLNKLNESNMRHICDQIEHLYMQHSRNEMNEALVHLVQQSVVLPYSTPEKLVMEHALLITVLHCNIGSEVGAHCLQKLVLFLDAKLEEKGSLSEGGKEIDNLLLLLCHLYTFKVTHNLLIYDFLKRLTERFLEKDIELILLILRSVGFALRKDDPLALKGVILSLQNKASSVSHLADQSRVRFMLETLMAIRNNNMQKIPNYDPSLAEHLRKFLKTLQRKGTYIQELHISLEDLLKADECGRWWIVGSAWQGKSTPEELGDESRQSSLQHHFSQEVLELAQKQHMNTEVRKNIFCVLVSAEDYMDAFEKLLRLSLKNQQDREIIHVALHCCLQEKEFNYYYPYLLEKFCTFDRKYQMVLQFAVWDKFKEMSKMRPFQVTNLAKCLVHLFTKNALPLSVLKTIQLSEMDKTLVTFLRQLLLAILLHESEEVCQKVFLRIAPAQKLHSMREGLRLFMLHFLLRNQSKLESHVASQLKERIDVAVTAMNSAENSRSR